VVPFFVIFSVGNYTASVKYCTPAWVRYIVLVIYFPGHMGYSTFYLFFMLICFFLHPSMCRGEGRRVVGDGWSSFSSCVVSFCIPSLSTRPSPSPCIVVISCYGYWLVMAYLRLSTGGSMTFNAPLRVFPVGSTD